jgi:DNA-binding MarR family transcriptional regulator
VTAEQREDDDESLAEAFWSVARQLRHQSKEALDPWGITPGQARALGVLTHHGLMRLSELSDHLRIAPRSTTEVVDALQERGLVERRADPTDRRATLIAVTGPGATMGEAVRAGRAAEGDRFFGALSGDDSAHLRRILRTLRTASSDNETIVRGDG